jgi:hypothetical protein
MTQATHANSTNVVPLRPRQNARVRHLRLLQLLQRERAWFDAICAAATPEEEAFALRAHFEVCREIDAFEAEVQRQPARNWSDVILRARIAKYKAPVDPDDLCPEFQRAARDLVDSIIRVSGGAHA